MSLCVGQRGYKTGLGLVDQEPNVMALLLSYRPYVGML
jgi:hypothetical protein